MEVITRLLDQFKIYLDHIIEKGPAIIIGLFIIFILHFILRTLRHRIISYMQEKADDKLLLDFANSFLRFFNLVLLFLLYMFIIGFGNIAGSILGAAGISAFVIGFALKDIGENFLAGVIMAFDRPFSLGDTIKTNDVEGVIKKMSLRDTHVKTFDGKDVFVPNGQIIKNPLYNYTMDGFIRHQFTVGVDYNTDIDQVRSIILDSLKNIPGILQEDKVPRTHVKNLNTSTVDIECHFWINTFDSKYSSLELKSMAQSKTINALSQADISMPADIIELKNYDSELKMKNQ